MTAGSTTSEYKTVGECHIMADVHVPPTREGTPPVIAWIHGGCLIYGSRRDIAPWQLGSYLDQGYVVVCMDYRLAPETRLPSIIEDLDDALSWIAETAASRHGFDGDRIAVVGHSAGGYLSLMSGFATRIRPRAIVSYYGYGDLIGDWYSRPDPFYCSQPAVSVAESGRLNSGPVISEPYEGRGKDSFYLYCRQNGLWPLEVGGRDPSVDAAFFTPYCPLQNVTAGHPPTMLLHGERDTDVPYEQSVLMHRELQRKGADSTLVTLADRGHGFDYDESDARSRAAFEQAGRFLRFHLDHSASEQK